MSEKISGQEVIGRESCSRNITKEVNAIRIKTESAKARSKN
jgi:hypothetical protein